MIALSRAMVLALLLALVACGGKPPPAAPRVDPRAAQDLATYRELVGANSLETRCWCAQAPAWSPPKPLCA